MLNIRPLQPELAVVARNELNEDPERIGESLDLLRKWIEKQPHLKSRTDDQFLLIFLRASKHSIERAKQKIDSFYSLRTAIPELFRNRSIDELNFRNVLKLGTGIVLPSPLGESGPRICMVRPGAYDPDKYSIYEILRPGSFVADIELMEDDNLIISGLIEIIDLANVTMAHLFQSDAVFLKKMATIGGEGSPLRHVGTHFINMPTSFETVFNVFKGFLSPSRRDRLFAHHDLQSLYEYVPQKYLPQEYGGSNSSINEITNYWEKKVTEYKDYFLEEEQFGTFEELRNGRKHYSENLFGVDGTFRSLNVD